VKVAFGNLQFDMRIGPSAIFGAMNFLALCFTAGMIWNSYTVKGDAAIAQLAANRLYYTAELDKLRAEQQRLVERLDNLRQQDTSIAVLKNDVLYIKDSIQRIEAAVQVGGRGIIR
jgi:hypothetical protein